MSSNEGFISRLASLGYSANETERLARLAERVRELKAERRAVILVHTYQRPEVFDVADAVGDSLALSRKAASIEGDVIVFCGVHFMAETAKILSPGRKVLLPNLAAGCSLAESAQAGDVAERIKELREKHPDLAVVSYVNTTAEVKALSDTVVTSANAKEVVNALPNRHILFLPDRNLAAWVQKNTDKVIIPWDGGCYVHQEITPEAVASFKRMVPDAVVMVHPECRMDVLKLADQVLSTEGMVNYARNSKAEEFIVVTECGMSDRFALEMPEKKFYRVCQMCRYMKMITLDDVVESLEKMQFEITLPEDVRVRAERAVRRMLELVPAAGAGAGGAKGGR